MMKFRYKTGRGRALKTIAWFLDGKEWPYDYDKMDISYLVAVSVYEK